MILMKTRGGLRRKTPVRLQFQTTECSIAAIRIVLAHYGCEPPAEEVRRVAGVSRDCANAADIARVARHYGFTCRAVTREPEELEALGFPLIVHLRFIHFSVLEGMGKTAVRLNDPSPQSHIELPIEQFRERFTGVALKIEPAPGSQGNRRRGRFYEQSPFRLRDPRLIAAAAGAFVSALSLIWMARLLGAWTDMATAGLARARLPILLLLVSAALLVRTASGAAYRILLRRVRDTQSRLREIAVLKHLLSLPHDFFLYRLPERLYETLRSIEMVTGLRTDFLAPAAMELATVPLILAGVWLSNSAIGLALAALFLCAMGGAAALSRWRAAIRRQDRSLLNPDTNSDLFEALDKVEKIKLGGHSHDFFTSVLGAEADRERLRQEHGLGATLAGAIPLAFEFAAFSVALGMGAFALEMHEVSVGGLLSALVLTAALRDPLRRFVAAQKKLEHIRLTEPYIADVLACNPDSATPDEFIYEPGPLPPEAGTVRFDNVSFGYAHLKPPIVKALSFEVRAGEQVGITGPSGGGKSTVAGLLTGLYRPWSGSVMLAGRPVETLPAQVRARIALWVSKTPHFIEDTVRENLLLGDPDIEDAALDEAISDACLTDVLAACPAGLETLIDPEARTFSGGQRQRLLIARALARRPAILILDEATDGLDTNLELRLRANLRRRGCTLLMISHRAGTLAACDRVLVVAGDQNGGNGSGISPAVEPSPACVSTEQRNSTMFEAFRQVAAAIGEDITLPDAVESRGDGAALQELARHNSIAYRRVRFIVPAWWRRDHGPLIAFSKTTGEPVAHVPGKFRPPQGGLSRVAYRLYPRVHSIRHSAASLFREGLRQARVDFIRAVCCVPAISILCLAPASVGLLLFTRVARGEPLPSAAKLGVTLALAGAALGMTLAVRAAAAVRFEGRMRLSVLTGFVQCFNRIEVRHIRKLTLTAAARSMAAIPRLLHRLVALPLRQIQECGIALAGLLFLLWIRPELALLAALLTLPLLVLPWWHARAALPAEQLHTDRRISQQRALFGMLQNMTPLRVFDLTGRTASRWHALRSNQLEIRRGIDDRSILRALAASGWVWGSAAAVTACGIVATPARLFALPVLFVAAWQLLSAAGRLGNRMATAMAALPFAQDAAVLLEGPVEDEGVPAPHGALNAVRFHNVSYRYPGNPVPALDHISLRIEPGQIIAITGPSGGGKSTLLRLLLGFDVPESGEIRRHCGGTGECALPQWREGVGAVFQDDAIDSDTTIRYQIAGMSDCGLDEVWRVARLAGLDSYIRDLPMGMQNIIGPGKISTGQQQRILIARQLLRRPRLLILDEATNAIPEQGQTELLAALRALGLTTVLVTHRASAVAMADRVFVIERGRLAFAGTPREMAAEAAFGEMLKTGGEFAL